jgi:iron complex outermembrane receptor protein
MYGGSLTALLVAMGIAAPNMAAAATATADATADATATADASSTASTVSEVVVTTGTRVTGVTAADSAAPIQVVGAQALVKTGAIDLASSLETAVPSLNIDANGGDMAALSVEAALRGLSPNDTLVLVDGKRRHNTANLFVDSGSAYTGAATVDLSFIPVDAIDHVEVLTDGAAAQYGTDAIAGVVNVILKHANDGGLFDGTAGQFYDGQGATGAWGLNKGIQIGDKGFLNVTLEERFHDFTVLGIGDRRLQSISGAPLPGLTAPSSNVVSAQGYPHENKLNGDPAFNLYNAEFNFGYDITPDLQLYAFGTAGYRLAGHYENYRVPTKVHGLTSGGATVYPLPFGFDPQEQIKELDGSITLGMKGKLADWNFDLATSYGSDHVDVWVINSANAQLFPVLQALSATPIAPQRNFFNGAFKTTSSTTTLDLDRGFDVGMASPLNIAFGGEARHESYSIGAGEPSSYFGAGAQSFDGYTPQDQGSHDRTNYAGYIDLALDPVQGLHLDLAGRYEHYSDFGSATVGKLTARYDFNPAFAVRGTISTGFRAPTIAEEFYSGTNVSPTSAFVSLPPNSASALLAGFQPLSPEKSTNYSIGFVAHPMEHMQITLDGYDIELRNRIVETGSIYGTFTFTGSIPTLISPGVLNAITSRGVTLDSGLSYTGIQLFTNGASTRTLGLDLTANYATDFDEWGHVDWTVGFNYNNTTVTKVGVLPAAVSTPSGGTIGTLGQFGPILNAVAISALTKETPQEKAILQALWTKGPFSLNLRADIYGPSSLEVQGGSGLFNEQIQTTGIIDIDVGYKFTDKIKLDIGANNLFDTMPPKVPLAGGTPVDGALVYNVPYTFAPWGSNGGYYYGRVTVQF